MRIIGCDLHARQQTIAMLDSDTGELEEKTLEHQGETVREFYSALSGPILVGIEATGSMQWFLELLEELGIECRVGHPAKIRKAETRKQKHDRRDARLLLTLLAENRRPIIISLIYRTPIWRDDTNCLEACGLNNTLLPTPPSNWQPVRVCNRRQFRLGDGEPGKAATLTQPYLGKPITFVRQIEDQNESFNASCTTRGLTAVLPMTPNVGEVKLVSGLANCG